MFGNMKFLQNIVRFLILISIVTIYGVEGTSTELKFEDKNITVNDQVNRLNKPAIKSFKKNGDIIDCVDIYKQPAFDHPLLKNHKLQMRPSMLPKPAKTKFSKKSSSRRLTKDESNDDERCPDGYIPIMRINKDDLVRANTVFNQRHPRFGSQAVKPRSNIHYAAITTPLYSPTTYGYFDFYGAKARISVYNLTVQASQIVEATLWIGSNVVGPYNSIEYGWTVNPQLYGDTNPRTYSLWTADGLANTGCYNSVCPGYVQVSQKIFKGQIIEPVSTFGGSNYAMQFFIFKDPKTNNWWLNENRGGLEHESVGYWQKELFPSMMDSAKMVQIGGKVYDPIPLSMGKQTPMGSGTFVPNDFTRTCYASNIEFVRENNTFSAPDVPIHVTADNPNAYKANYLGYAGNFRQYSALFGGPHIQAR